MPLTLHLSLFVCVTAFGSGRKKTQQNKKTNSKNLRHHPLLSCFLMLLQYLCPVARDGAFWNTSCGCMLWFSILLVHTIFLMSHSSSGALHRFDKGNRGTNQTNPLYLTPEYPVDLLEIDSFHNCRERCWAVTATAKPAYCAISAVSA